MYMEYKVYLTDDDSRPYYSAELPLYPTARLAVQAAMDVLDMAALAGCECHARVLRMPDADVMWEGRSRRVGESPCYN